MTILSTLVTPIISPFVGSSMFSSNGTLHKNKGKINKKTPLRMERRLLYTWRGYLKNIELQIINDPIESMYGTIANLAGFNHCYHSIWKTLWEFYHRLHYGCASLGKHLFNSHPSFLIGRFRHFCHDFETGHK